MKIRKNDSVVVTTGEHKSSHVRKVTSVTAGGRRLVIEGVNRVYRHVRRGHPKSPQGGRLRIELPIDASNVMLYCGSCSRPTRAGYRYADDGTKERYCKRCSGAMGTVGPPKKAYASPTT